MKTHVPALAVAALTLLTAPLAHAGDDAPVTSATVDVDGDGKPESLTLEWSEDAPKPYVLKVGSATIQGASKEEAVSGFTIVDLDASDRRKEIAVHTGNTDEDARTDLFSYDGKKLKALGSVPKLTEVKGNSIILSDQWKGFWNQRDKFTYDAKAGKVSEVPQELYYVGSLEAKVRQSFPITYGRADKKPVANLAVGSTIQVLAATLVTAPGGRSRTYVYLVKSSTGLMGWVPGPELVEKTEGLPIAG
ncbi:hypothetical protein LZ198_27130 [Myxococcus sp. K15C18031901]|uniref:hypothetical protein n=1 Tax=Myxococcus dinghuensis TaxID=2906761 RepID=UPI0020A78726|nr:hypothetical protein [Myxococcus dinghuensis]MCP3102553.1 hypothetical protein [Myxococcus dinghuensis]